MNIIESILKARTKKEIYTLKEGRNDSRYADESFFVFLLANYALNKEKNRIKPNFEGMELLSIFTHLVSETNEIKHELNQDIIDYKNLLEEIADCAALLSGLVAYIIEHKEDKM